MKQGLIIIILSAVAYSLGCFAYVHSTFTTKDYQKIVDDRLIRIENKIDRMLENK